MADSETKFKQTEPHFAEATRDRLGEISEDWEILKVSDVAEVYDSLHQTPHYTETGKPMVRVVDLCNGILDTTNALKVDNRTFDIFNRKYSPQESDVVVSRVGSYGIFCRVGRDKNFCLGQNTAIIHPRIDGMFLFYALNSPITKQQVESLVSGSTQKTLSLENINNLLISVPKKTEQQKIAEVLGALDEKIELNRKMNKTLESLAQAIFEKWFIDDADPNWETKKLGDAVRIKYGKNLPTAKLQESGYPVFGGNGLIGFFDKYLYELPQVLVACRGAASGKVNFSLPKSFVTNNSLVLEYDDPLNYEFLKYFALNADFYSCVSGSAQPQITIESLAGYEIMMPDREILNKFGQIVAPISQKILLNDNEISNLSQIRDSLLPRLMSGKLRVT